MIPGAVSWLLGSLFYDLAFFCSTRYNIHNLLPAYKVNRVLRQYRNESQGELGLFRPGSFFFYFRGSKGEEKMTIPYNPASPKADEFINHQEILDTLAFADKQSKDLDYCRSLLEKART